jgi:N-acetylglucosaminyl-diphospho-decaprenol L-rhamnosyltransferase
MKTTAIFVTYNSAAVIGAALASLPPGLPVIVVDNASGDDSASIAEAAGATVIRRPSNAGFGVANNDGMRAAATECVLLMNPDARLLTGCLETLLAVMRDRTDAAILAPTVRTKGGISRKWSSPITAPAFRSGETRGGATPIGFASGAVFLARREVLLALGGFDEQLFMYFEDDDLSRRVLDAGHTILHVPAAEAEHTGNVSTPPSSALTYMKHWHLAWSERQVRRKFGLAAPGWWRIAESAAKLLWAQLRRDRMEEAKQLGLVNGTLGHIRGLKAQEVRDTVVMERQ